jgi:uncharacterized protein YfaS (alpha-2-macroglobulin family)
MNETVSSYIYAYSSGTVSRADLIKVRFTQPAVSEDQFGIAQEKKLLDLSPAASGSTFWEDAYTLVFQPDGFLNSGTTYLATVQLDEIFPNVPSDARSFEFDFRTRELRFTVEVEGLESPDPTDLSKQEVKGWVQSTDAVLPENLDGFLTASQNGRALPIRWSAGGGKNNFQFAIGQVSRGDNTGQVELAWDATSVGGKQQDDLRVEIPALGDFRITNARVHQSPQQYISLHFSDPLNPEQNLDGLIRISDFGENLSYSIDGNTILIYPSARIQGQHTIRVETGLRNSQNSRMESPSEFTLTFTEEPPNVFLVGRGVIMPNSDGLYFPFEAVNLHAVEVEVFKIFNNNILQFLQANDLDGDYELNRVGRIVLQKKVDLSDLNSEADPNQRVRYALDLSDLITADPEAIYQIRIGFRPSYTDYYCGEEAADTPAELTNLAEDDDQNYESIMAGWYGIDGYYQGYEWRHREDPCFPAYYNSDRFVSRNVVVSNLGIICKGGNDDSAYTIVTDLRTGQPVAGARVEFYDYQQQLIGSLTTDNEGFGNIQLDGTPFVAIASKGTDQGYLKLDHGMSVQLSRFDVGGVSPQNGLKGYLYGERGVWRPGDSLYLHFVLEDETGDLPDSHPIQFELYDARGQLYERRVTSENVGHIYPLHLATTPDAATGNWRAVVNVGGAQFSKTLSIETIKPNRLKIDLDFGGDEIKGADGQVDGILSSQWLHGAVAANLKARVESQLRAINTTFDDFPSFEFDDPARRFSAQPQVVFDGSLDGQGKASFTTNLLQNGNAPGKLRASFKTRVFERGGDASIDQVSLPFSPYSQYAGVEIPTGKYGEKRLNIGEAKTLRVAIVDENGNPVANQEVDLGLYRVQWRWWWDRSGDRLSDYATDNHYNAEQKATVRTNSQGIAEWSVQVDKWGRYLLRACDGAGDHCAGDFFYAGYPWYDEGGMNQQEAAMLAFTSSQETYEVGETIELRVPASADGRILVSLENGTQVLDTRWETAVAGENIIRIEATPDMSPTIYANISLLQPHGQGGNDLPTRMYGVLPIRVEDPNTLLKPQLDLPDVLEPEQTVTVEVSEEDGKAMAYTLAIVDEGLLDLTRFATPDPWNSFYAKEALGIRTFDVYDYVLGGTGGEFERILSIGGDDDVRGAEEKDQANRFKPVVIHLGPFALERGEKAEHEVTIPNYVGSVRVMAVAANEGAYGNTEKTVPVRKPVMVLATLPRVLGPGEQLQLPVNVFAMEEGISQVQVTLTETSGLVNIQNGNSQQLQFARPGDQLTFFDLQVGDRVGIAKFKVEATGGGKKASQEIEIEIRNPNPYVTDVLETVLEGQNSWEQSYQPVGMPGTNEAVLEVSSLPPIDLDRHLDYLIRYPYGCLEQTLSGGFPQLYLADLVDLPSNQQDRIPENIRATITRLRTFQVSQGGFAYWPGNSHINHWSNSYAGHFLLAAKEKGYAIPAGMLDRWLGFQRKLARQWDPRQFEAGFYSHHSDQLSQAYRLYTLALANQPELGAMNRLREMKDLGVSAQWRLALAYALSGKPDIASQMVQGLTSAIGDYRETGHTFGSSYRDRAMILEAMVQLDMRTEAAELVKILAEQLSSQRWFSTQDLAFNLMAIGKFVEGLDLDQQVSFAYQIDGGSAVNASADQPVLLIQLPADGGAVKVTNQNQGLLYARIVRRGQPLVGDQTTASSNLSIQVAYRDMQGQPINPGQLEQGTDFVAEVTVNHPGFPFEYRYDEMALSQIFPSGWEITNARMTNVSYFSNSSRPEYQDFRDDRVLTFFDIYSGKQQIYRVQLTASYAGRYYLPSISCEAMYDDRIYARQPGQWVEVIRPQAG